MFDGSTLSKILFSNQWSSLSQIQIEGSRRRR